MDRSAAIVIQTRLCFTIASTGTGVSSPCSRSAAMTWSANRSCSGRGATVHAPTWSASVDRLRDRMVAGAVPPEPQEF